MAFRIDPAAPVWQRTTLEPRTAQPPLATDIDVDVCVVGGGYTGLSAALGVASAGMRVAVLEAATIGSGSSGRNVGAVLAQHSRSSPREVIARLGPARGERYNELVADAARRVFALVATHSIRCDAIIQGWIQPAHCPSALHRIRQFHDEWRAFGARVAWLDRGEVADVLGATGYLGGWETSQAGHINPHALATGLARACEQAGARIFENTQALSLTRLVAKWHIGTRHGNVFAREVFLATNAFTDNLWPTLAATLIPVQIYAVATNPVPPDVRAAV